MCRFLHGPRNGTYYFRRPIPETLRPIVGQREWMFSLRVKDREIAKGLVAVETVRTDALISEAKKILAGSRPLSNEERKRQRRADDHARAREDHDDLAATLQAHADDARETRIAAQRAEADDLEIRISGSTAQMRPADAVVARAIREAREEAELYRERWLNQQAKGSSGAAGDSRSVDAGATAPALAKSTDASQRTPQGKLEPVTITGLFAALVARGRLSPAIAKEWQSGINKFVAFVEHDDARRVAAQDVLRWRNHERDTPKADGQPRSAQRINAGYLGALRAAFKYGMEEMLIDADPAAAVPKLREATKVVTRDRQFTKDEQKTILSAASKIDTSGKPPRQSLVRRWVPWICAYTGARVNEVTQLRAEDVQEIDGQWVIHITPAAGRVKNKAFRNAPIHEHLIEQGFLAFVKSQGDGPLFYNPERGEDDSERGQFKKVGERLAGWVRSLGITDPDIMPNHAWRHTFTSIAMECGMDERAADYIKGHASQGVSRRHYTHHTIKALAEQLARFPYYQSV